MTLERRIVVCRPARDYTLWLRFSDGLQGTVDVARLLEIGCFKFWRDMDAFLEGRAHTETGGAWWPAGVHLDAQILYEDLRARGARPPAPERDPAFRTFMAKALVPIKGLHK